MPGGAWKATRDWGTRFWGDLKSSTDASLLAILRFVGLLYGPIDSRLPIDRAFRKSLHRRLSRYAGWKQAFGGITYLLFMVLVVTGVLLSFYYRPSAEEAYQSIQNVVSGVTLGWLMRDAHVWAANLIVLAALLHMGRVFFGAAYKPPRETNWLVGLVLLFVIFAFGATGYLLPWDQWAYWTVTEGLDILGRAPLVGGAAVELLRGDPLVSGATLSRFFALHVIVLPWLALGLLVLHFTLVRKHGIAPPARLEAEDVGPDDESGVPFFPNHFLRSLIVGVLVLSLVITAAALYPRAIAAQANPARPPSSMLSTWIVADVSRALIYYLGGWGFGGYLLLGAVMVLLPLFDRSPERRLRKRPIVASLGVIFFLGFGVAWVAGRQLRSGAAELAPFTQPVTTPGPALPTLTPVVPAGPAATPAGSSSTGRPR
jgi:quinol-cytochrome oxidoreductase complex cytochrome b subunit